MADRWRSGEVRINGRRVERGAWHITRPKLGTALRPIIITMHAAYHGGALGGGGGGGGSSKNIFTTVAAIALVTGAVLVSGGLLGPAAAAGGSAIGTGALGTACGIGGKGSRLCPCAPDIWQHIRPEG